VDCHSTPNLDFPARGHVAGRGGRFDPTGPGEEGTLDAWLPLVDPAMLPLTWGNARAQQVWWELGADAWAWWRALRACKARACTRVFCGPASPRSCWFCSLKAARVCFECGACAGGSITRVRPRFWRGALHPRRVAHLRRYRRPRLSHCSSCTPPIPAMPTHPHHTIHTRACIRVHRLSVMHTVTCLPHLAVGDLNESKLLMHTVWAEQGHPPRTWR
jgi:hypothetical protein